MKYQQLIVLILLVFTMLACQNNNFKMASAAMEPTIMNGEIISADLSIYKNQDPERLDIVMFNSPGDPKTNWAMRIVGLPGEQVSFDSSGILINGERLSSNEPGIIYQLLSQGTDSSKYMIHPYTIPADHFYLLGDNVNDSYDSRFWGAIAKDKIIGKIEISD